MQRLGITGGIASGKSVVARMLRELGFHVMDADRLSHELMEPGQVAFAETVKEFGPAILGEAGRIDRPKLGALVFADRAKLEKLNAIVHPLVEKEMGRRFAAWEHEGVQDAAFVEAALLVEAGYQKRLDGLVVAWCQPEQQMERLLARGVSEDEARRRIASQMPVEEKLRYATEKIDCSGTMEETRRQVETLAAKLRRSGEPK
jgi:dephospho-CoA kinase